MSFGLWTLFRGMTGSASRYAAFIGACALSPGGCYGLMAAMASRYTLQSNTWLSTCGGSLTCSLAFGKLRVFNQASRVTRGQGFFELPHEDANTHAQQKQHMIHVERYDNVVTHG